jgi:hypothetical protein
MYLIKFTTAGKNIFKCQPVTFGSCFIDRKSRETVLLNYVSSLLVFPSIFVFVGLEIFQFCYQQCFTLLGLILEHNPAKVADSTALHGT